MSEGNGTTGEGEESNGTTEGEEKSITLEETFGVDACLPNPGWWKRNAPYPSSVGIEEGEYIPQPKFEITANNQWWQSKLATLRTLAEESRWVLRVVAAVVLVIAAFAGSRPPLIRVVLVVLSLFLVIIAFVSIRAEAHAEKPTVDLSPNEAGKETTPENDEESH